MSATTPPVEGDLLTALGAAAQATAAAYRAVGVCDTDGTVRLHFTIEERSRSGPNPAHRMGRETWEQLRGADAGLSDVVEQMQLDGVHWGRPTEVAARADGTTTVSWVEGPRGRDGSDVIGDIALAKARPKVRAPEVQPLTETLAPNDLGAIRKMLSDKGFREDGGFTDAQVAAAEKRRRVTFPPELRLFFSMVKKGTVLTTRGAYAEVVDGLKGGTLAYGNVVDPNKRALTASVLYAAPPEPSPDDVVQPLLATKHWVVFADDGGGNSYALDLAPGPRGAIGQVVQFDHETYDPPDLVADSLTDFLAGRLRPLARRKAVEGTVYVNHRATRALTAEHRGVRELNLGVCTEPPVLAPITGAPRLTALAIAREGYPADPEVLRTFEALTYLDAPVDVWQRLLQGGHLPGTLERGTISDEVTLPLARHVEVAAAVLEHYGQPSALRVERREA